MRYFQVIVSLALLLLLLPYGRAQEQMIAEEPLVVSDSLNRYWTERLSGGPPKDGIPSIDEPRFESVADADRWLNNDDRIIGLYRNEVARAYPQSVLVWHEIVNDTVDGEGIAITYCPLTGTALGFKRGDVELGVSGDLINSNLIMYDRETDSYWPQMLATAVKGPLKGKSLAEVRLIWTTWAQWKQRYPDTEVLSQRTGYGRNYRRDPYGSYAPRGGYYADNSLLFPPTYRSERYPLKQEVFGFRTASEAFAVDLDALKRAGGFRYEGRDGSYLILNDAELGTAWVYRQREGALPDRALNNELRFTREGPQGDALEGLEPVPGFNAMWFAWYAFYPETVVLDGS